MKWPCIFRFLSVASPAAASCNPPPGAIVTADAASAASKIYDSLKRDREILQTIRNGAKQKIGWFDVTFYPKGRAEETHYWTSVGCRSGDDCGSGVLRSNVEDASEIVSQVIERKIESQEQQLCALGVRP